MRQLWSFPVWWIATALLLTAEPMLENRGVRWFDQTLVAVLLPAMLTIVLAAMALASSRRSVPDTVKRAFAIAAIPPVVLLALWFTGTDVNVHGAAVLTLIVDLPLCELSCVILLVVAGVHRVRGAP